MTSEFSDLSSHWKARLASIEEQTKASLQRIEALVLRDEAAPGDARRSQLHEFNEAGTQILDAVETLSGEVRLAHEQGRKLRDELESLAHEGAAQSRLLATASHDLLQPLGAIHLFISTLRSSQLRPQNRKLVERAYNALASAELLLESLLEISELDSQGSEPALTTFPISSLLSTLENEFEPAATRKSLSLRVILSTTRIVSDLTMLRRILQNLVGNAINYTDAGKVILGCRRTADGLRLEVHDTGRGIAPDEIDRIFDEFYRIDSSASGQGGRAGLGLSIVKRLATLLGHKIAVASSPGRGTCFSVTVPYGRAMPALRPDDLAPQPSLPPDMLVVVVENDDIMRDAVTTQLDHWDCQVIATSTPNDAMNSLESYGRRPDALVIDQHLDGNQTGLALIAGIRTRFGSEIPAILVTADRSSVLQSAAAEARCEYLAKPFRPDSLEDLLRKSLSR